MPIPSPFDKLRMRGFGVARFLVRADMVEPFHPLMVSLSNHEGIGTTSSRCSTKLLQGRRLRNDWVSTGGGCVGSHQQLLQARPGSPGKPLHERPDLPIHDLEAERSIRRLRHDLRCFHIFERHAAPRRLEIHQILSRHENDLQIRVTEQR